MYTTDPDLRSYVAMCLSDAQIALKPGELDYLNQQKTDQRRERRFPVNEDAMLFLFNSPNPQPISAQLFDVFRRGLGVSTTRPLPSGTDVQAQMKGVLVVGETRYCKPVGNLFHTGV